MKIGFIGLGNMGAGMAANLLKSGHEVTAYNRSQDKIAALAEQGATPAKSVAEACDGDIVITMLANDNAVEAVTLGDDGVIASLRPGAADLRVEHDQRRAVGAADRRARRGQPAVRRGAGVRQARSGSGGKAVRGRGRGCRDAAGSLACIRRDRPADVGCSEDPKAANLVKLSGNFLIASVIESLGEAMALVAKAGVDGTSSSRSFHVDAVWCAGVQDVRWPDRARRVRACRFRGRTRRQGRPAGACGGRGVADAAADRQPIAGSLPDTAGQRWRRPGLVGGRRAAAWEAGQPARSDLDGGGLWFGDVLVVESHCRMVSAGTDGCG